MRPQFLNPPRAPKEYILDLSRLDGGLNLWELDYRIAANQSPEMENMMWVDGALGSRRGQEYMYDTALDPILAAHEKLFNDMVVFHAGTKLYKMNPATGATTEIYSGVTTQWGTFYVFKDNLYYKNGKEFLKITSTFTVTAVAGYEPVMAINRNPDGTGGNLYEPENRIAAGKYFHFTSDGVSTKYVLPIQGLDATLVTAVVNGVDKFETTDFTVNRTTGEVTFNAAPTQSDPPVLNNVKIKAYKTNTDAMKAIMDCRYAITYGEGNDIGVVLGGSSAQPNAYFWSGSNSATVDPTYFPMEYYNLAGNTNEPITGFGKQQNLLIIFKEGSIGKTSYSIVTINGQDMLQMPYTGINPMIGCDLPRTIQLVTNNLVFCNTSGGVYMISDTTTSYENNVIRLSRNINGTDARPGLLYGVRKVTPDKVVAIDDDKRYMVTANGHTYAWDYILSPFNWSEEKLSWFYFTGILPTAWVKDLDNLYHGTVAGKFVRRVADRNDFGQAFTKKFRFATQFFGTYERLKDVKKIIFTVRSDTDTEFDITYDSDYETRQDPNPIMGYSYKLSPRNLSLRFLRSIKYAMANVRKPRCLHVRHFSMTLSNNSANMDMSVVGAQIFYSFSAEDR